MLADFFDGKEDEEAQKTFQKFSQQKNLSLDIHTLKLNTREKGTFTADYSNREHCGPRHLRKADLAENITENTVVLDMAR